MTSKAYIVANEQQEREVLEKLEEEGLVWISGREATEWIPSQTGLGIFQFPYSLVDVGYVAWRSIGQLKNDEIVYDGRKEEQGRLDMTLTIFTNNGQTFMFKDVTDFTYTTTVFKLSYTGEMTGVERHAVFNNASVAGYALAD